MNPVQERFSFHFDFGNSTDGPIGYCARIFAVSKEEAVTTLRDIVDSQLSSIPVRVSDPEGRVEYIENYLNSKAITNAHIDMFEQDDDCDDEK